MNSYQLKQTARSRRNNAQKVQRPLLEADAEYQDNPSLARLCYLVADLITGKVGNKK